MTVFVYLPLYNSAQSFAILFFHFYRSLVFVWEDISNIQNSVWPHSQTPQSSSKILRHTSYFHPPSQCLQMCLNTIFRVWFITSKLVCFTSFPHTFFATQKINNSWTKLVKTTLIIRKGLVGCYWVFIISYIFSLGLSYQLKCQTPLLSCRLYSDQLLLLNQVVMICNWT